MFRLWQFSQNGLWWMRGRRKRRNLFLFLENTWWHREARWEMCFISLSQSALNAYLSFTVLPWVQSASTWIWSFPADHYWEWIGNPNVSQSWGVQSLACCSCMGQQQEQSWGPCGPSVPTALLSILPAVAEWCILIRARVNYIGLREPDFFTTAWGKWKD